MFKQHIFVHALALVSCLVVLSAKTTEQTSALPDAMEQAAFRQVEILLSEGTDVNTTQTDGATALIWAAYHAKAEWVERLLNEGADPLATNRFGVQAISLACQNGDAQSTRLLLDAGANPNFTLNGGESLLLSASRSGDSALVQTLIDAGAKVDHKIQGGQTPLMWAASEGHAAVVAILLKAGADPLAASRNGFTSIHFAARAGHIPVLRHLLEAGVDINLPVKWKGNRSFRAPLPETSPLILAIENAQFAMAVELLKAGANPNDNRTGYGPLHTMTWVRKAHTGDSNDPEPPNYGKITSREFLTLLIEHGADVNQPAVKHTGGSGLVTDKGGTPFFMAADRGDVEMMTLLVTNGADPSIPNANGTTALIVAAGTGRGAENDQAGTQEDAMAAVAYCLELGLDINAVDSNRETAMHGAAYGQWPKMTQFLYENGADIQVWNQMNKYKWSPLLIAQGYRRGNFKPAYDMIEAIESIMAREGVTLRYDPPGAKKGYDGQ